MITVNNGIRNSELSIEMRGVKIHIITYSSATVNVNDVGMVKKSVHVSECVCRLSDKKNLVFGRVVLVISVFVLFLYS